MSDATNFLVQDLVPHCVPESDILFTISTILGTCVPTYLYLFSNILGYLSITAWLFAQLPQVFKNYHIKSVDGLSPVFLCNWLLGDVCNFTGAVLTHQMLFQQIIGMYYMIIDMALCSQYWWYTRQDSGYARLSGVQVLEASLPDDYESEESRPSSVEGKKRFSQSPARSARSGTGSTRKVLAAAVLGGSKLAEGAPLTKVLDKIPTEVKMATASIVLDSQLIGNLSAWISASLYLSSRIPQLYKNYQRRSCQGLSIYLFVAAFFGNLFYSLSLLLNPLGMADYPPYGAGGIAGPEGSNQADWWRDALPFFVGAAGVLSMDAAVGAQWLLWGEQEPLKADDEDEVVLVSERMPLLN